MKFDETYYDEHTNCICIKSEPRSGGYCVDLDRCKSAEDLLEWIYALCGKRFCTPRLIEELIDHVEMHTPIKRNIYC